MELRVQEVPEPGSRVAWGYLSAVAALIGGLLLFAVAWQLITFTPSCQFDASGFCQLFLGVSVVALCYAVALAMASWVFRLGWAFFGVVVGLGLLALQLAVQTSDLLWVAPLAFAPAVAALVTSPGPDGRLPRRRRIVLGSVGVVVVLQMGLWALLLLR